LPPTILERAREVLHRLEKYEIDVFSDGAHGDQTSETPASEGGNENRGLDRAVQRAARRQAAAQASLFDVVNKDVLDEMRSLKVDALSPDEARAFLIEIQGRLI
jgi:DNA mismatch repair ATPase MutS